MNKKTLLKQVNHAMTVMSMQPTVDVDTIEKLRRLKVAIEIATADELVVISERWQRMTQQR